MAMHLLIYTMLLSSACLVLHSYQHFQCICCCQKTNHRSRSRLQLLRHNSKNLIKNMKHPKKMKKSIMKCLAPVENEDFDFFPMSYMLYMISIVLCGLLTISQHIMPNHTTLRNQSTNPFIQLWNTADFTLMSKTDRINIEYIFNTKIESENGLSLLQWSICYCILMVCLLESVCNFYRFYTTNFTASNFYNAPTKVIVKYFSVYAVFFTVLFICTIHFYYWLFPLVSGIHLSFNVYCIWQFGAVLIERYTFFSELETTLSEVHIDLVETVNLMRKLSIMACIFSSLFLFLFLVIYDIEMVCYLTIFWTLNNCLFVWNFVRNRQCISGVFLPIWQNVKHGSFRIFLCNKSKRRTNQFDNNNDKSNHSNKLKKVTIIRQLKVTNATDKNNAISISPHSSKHIVGSSVTVGSSATMLGSGLSSGKNTPASSRSRTKTGRSSLNVTNTPNSNNTLSPSPVILEALTPSANGQEMGSGTNMSGISPAMTMTWGTPVGQSQSQFNAACLKINANAQRVSMISQSSMKTSQTTTQQRRSYTKTLTSKKNKALAILGLTPSVKQRNSNINKNNNYPNTSNKTPNSIFGKTPTFGNNSKKKHHQLDSLSDSLIENVVENDNANDDDGGTYWETIYDNCDQEIEMVDAIAIHKGMDNDIDDSVSDDTNSDFDAGNGIGSIGDVPALTISISTPPINSMPRMDMRVRSASDPYTKNRPIPIIKPDDWLPDTRISNTASTLSVNGMPMGGLNLIDRTSNRSAPPAIAGDGNYDTLMPTNPTLLETRSKSQDCFDTNHHQNDHLIGNMYDGEEKYDGNGEQSDENEENDGNNDNDRDSWGGMNEKEHNSILGLLVCHGFYSQKEWNSVRQILKYQKKQKECNL